MTVRKRICWLLCCIWGCSLGDTESASLTPGPAAPTTSSEFPDGAPDAAAPLPPSLAPLPGVAPSTPGEAPTI